MGGGGMRVGGQVRRKRAGQPPAPGTWEMWVKRKLRSFWGKDQPLAGRPGAWGIRSAALDALARSPCLLRSPPASFPFSLSFCVSVSRSRF